MPFKNVNLIDLYQSFKALLSAGNQLKASGSLVNTEATAAALYGVVSALVHLMQDLGIDLQVSWVDMHTMTSGWAISASFFYAIYRVVTNKDAGFHSSTSAD
jgi:hypothetical protein